MMINLGRSPSGQEYADLMLRQNKILGNMLGADIDLWCVALTPRPAAW